MELKKARSYITVLAVTAAMVGLYFSSLYNYLLFHSLAELFSILVAFGIFVIAWNSRQFLDNNYFIFIGVAYLFVGATDLIHTLAYQGMGIFTGYGTNLATQLWLSARYMESITLLIAPFFIGRRIKFSYLMPIYGLITALLLMSIFYWDIFPVSYIEGSGLTAFKRISEYVIAAILVGAIITLSARRRDFDSGVLRLLYLSIIVTIGSELAFTLYESPYGVPNLIGHLLKIISFYCIYKAIIETGLVQPYRLLFRNLKQSEEAYRSLYEEAPNAYISVGTNGRIERANRSAGELFGYSRDELLGQSAVGLFADTTQGRVKSEEIFRRFLTGEEIRDEEVEMRRADGTSVWGSLSMRPITDGRGKLIARRLAVVDITERKKLDQLKDDFISLVSHELRSPMTVITGAINTALTEEERLTPEERRQLLKDASVEADTLSNILVNLLELSRIQANRLALNSEPINAKKVIRTAIEEIKRQGSGHQFVSKLPRDLPAVDADELRLERILHNLLENAVKYSPPESTIRVAAQPQDKYLVISVSDEGPGITPADQTRLFAPFQRLEKGRPGGARGVGLGLLVCRRLVEAHGGQIWVDSTPGKGATFSFTIPLSRSQT
jgi:PAS domain S-box-containing protein